MIQDFALIDNEMVVNLIVWDGDTTKWQAPEGLTVVVVPEGVAVSIGYSYTDGTFNAPAQLQPAVVVPEQVTMRQARLALLAAGKLAAVSAAISALPSPQKEAAQIEWEYAATVDRSSAFVQLMAVGLQLDAAALDVLFTQAGSL